MNALVTTETTTISENLASPPFIDTISSPKDLNTREPSLSLEQEAFLRDRFSTKLEDPQTGRWIRFWHSEG